MKISELRKIIREEISLLSETDVPVKKRGDTIVVDNDVPSTFRYLSGKKLKVLNVKKEKFASGDQIYYVVKDRYGEEEVPHRFVAE